MSLSTHIATNFFRKTAGHFKNRKNCLLQAKMTLTHIAPIAAFSTESWLADPSVVHSDVQPLEMPNLDMCSAFFPKWETYGKSIALECTSTGQTLSFTDLIELSLRWSKHLEKIENSLKSDKRIVAILAPNIMEFIPLLFGTLANGRVFMTINTNYKTDEVAYQLKDAKPTILIVDPEYELLAEAAMRESMVDLELIVVGKSLSGRPNLKDVLYDRNFPKALSYKQVSPTDEATVLYSSGTTGRPKGVVATHMAITNNVLSMTHRHFHPVANPREETVLGTMPPYHAFGLFIILLCNLYHGTKVAVLRHFVPETYGEILRRFKVGTLHTVPTLLNFLTNSALVTEEDLQFIKRIWIAGAPVLTSAANAFKEKAPGKIEFSEGFGMTEVLLTHGTPLSSAKLGYCGKLYPNCWAKVVDPDSGNPVPRGQRGELLLKSSGAMSHYLNNSKATEETIDANGFVRTGDVAVCTDDGYFKIVDRIKELIKVKGFQVSPAEVEDVLMSHPAVAEAGVVGIPDERDDEKVRAYVTLKSKVDEQELKRYVGKKLAKYKHLTGGVRIIDVMPKNQTGKLLRKELKVMAQQEGS